MLEDFRISPADSLDIAIAGCGPAGLAAALLLHRGGHRVTLFERFDEPRPLGSGLMLQPTGMAVLAKLGLAEAVAMRGARIDALKGLEEHGRTALDAPYSRLGLPGAFGIGIHRASLFDVLYQAALGAGIEIQTAHEITGSALAAGGRQLIFADGARSRPMDLLVDATGWNTPLGDGGADSAGASVLPFGALWASLPVAPDDSHARNLLEQRYRRASQMVGVLPIGTRGPGQPQEVAFFWSLKGADHARWLATPLDDWKAEVRALWPQIAFLLDRIHTRDQLTFARYAHRTARRSHGDKFIRIGDAWHSASPQLGQGANMALLDAWALAQRLSEGRSVTEALRYVCATRRGHVALYQAVTAAFTPLFQSDSTLLPALRDRVLAPLSGFAPVARIQAQLMSGLFGWPLAMLGLDAPDYAALAAAQQEVT
ncbi:FAD-dependent oxidoreductase [Qipengyuania marisflavi]|uniref:FAD-dependent monooxygenase n=1 Tax=Qipengyuania marisflavi TaxID=2486356 RepID=A0A5S3PC80_9SPHN|nr:NAD(P)/FAD-dependent oxidoreductase [Qipengyuania marisflavi]TMM48849.1 FAD-dependent monooxygenase [Qipengyuania marisflavi]